MNKREFLKNSPKLIVFIFAVFLYCDKNPFGPEEYRNMARGYWQASGGDILVEGEIGLITHSRYAIDTSAGSDSVFVIWDDGIACTTTPAFIKDNTIKMSVYNVQATFEIINNTELIGYFISSNKSYKKILTKKSSNPSEFCCSW